ncbi:MAG: hypothetical protein CMJ54_08010 [Planctomycetaceae bacterium]|nr:hypothetical protein [Planctomycetaceae bacterium]
MIVKAGRAWAGCLLLMLMAMAVGIISGCVSEVRKDVDRGPGRPGDQASWETIRDLQNRRVGQLERFSSAGTLTITLADGEEVDREQADHRIWRSGPSRAAIRVSKLGTSIMTAAWNGPRWWMFDERQDEVVLRIHPVEAPTADDAEASLLSPPTLFAMLGLLRFPDSMPQDLVLFDEGCRFSLGSIDWGATAAPLALRGGIEIEIASPRDGPTSVRMIGDADREIARATLSRFGSVDRIGSPPGDWPILPRRVEVRRGSGDRLVMSFDAPVANGRVSDRLFDLDAQIRRSEPAVIEDDTLRSSD